MARKKYRYSSAGSLHGFPINNHDSNLLNDRLNALYGVMATSIRDHNRLLVQRFDLRCPQGVSIERSDSELIARFMKKINRYWSKEKRGKLHYVWCKEVETSKSCHWHFAFVVDDKYTQPGYLTRIINKSWSYALGSENFKSGVVHMVQYTRFSKHDKHAIGDTIHWLSYLCKHRKGTTVTKGCFRTSRIDKALSIPFELNEQEQEAVISRARQSVYKNKT